MTTRPLLALVSAHVRVEHDGSVAHCNDLFVYLCLSVPRTIEGLPYQNSAVVSPIARVRALCVDAVAVSRPRRAAPL